MSWNSEMCNYEGATTGGDCVLWEHKAIQMNEHDEMYTH